jgi:hypothetical protein
MKTTLPLSAPRPGAADQDALDRFTGEGAPAPAEPLAARIACPALLGTPQRYRMPLWRFFDKRGY